MPHQIVNFVHCDVAWFERYELGRDDVFSGYQFQFVVVNCFCNIVWIAYSHELDLHRIVLFDRRLQIGWNR